MCVYDCVHRSGLVHVHEFLYPSTPIPVWFRMYVCTHLHMF